MNYHSITEIQICRITENQKRKVFFFMWENLFWIQGFLGNVWRDYGKLKGCRLMGTFCLKCFNVHSSAIITDTHTKVILSQTHSNTPEGISHFPQNVETLFVLYYRRTLSLFARNMKLMWKKLKRTHYKN